MNRVMSVRYIVFGGVLSCCLDAEGPSPPPSISRGGQPCQLRATDEALLRGGDSGHPLHRGAPGLSVCRLSRLSAWVESKRLPPCLIEVDYCCVYVGSPGSPPF